MFPFTSAAFTKIEKCALRALITNSYYVSFTTTVTLVKMFILIPVVSDKFMLIVFPSFLATFTKIVVLARKTPEPNPNDWIILTLTTLMFMLSLFSIYFLEFVPHVFSPLLATFTKVEGHTRRTFVPVSPQGVFLAAITFCTIVHILGAIECYKRMF